MPNFDLKQDDAIAIASFIWSQSREEGDKWTKEQSDPCGFREGDQNQIGKGKKLVETIGCKGCHGFAKVNFPRRWGKKKI